MPTATTAPHRWLLPSAVAVVGAALIGGFAARSLRAPVTTPPAVQRLTVDLPPKTQLATSSMETVALSPDGAHLVYAASGAEGLQLYLRKMDAPGSVPLPGTDGGGSPCFSPDGQWIGFLQAQI